MGFRNQLDSFDDEVKSKTIDTWRPSSSGESFDAAVGQAIDEDLSTSKFGWSTMDLIPGSGDIDYTHNDDREEQIHALIDSGELPENYLDNFQTKPAYMGYTTDYESASDAINQDFDFDKKFKTTEELHAERVKELDSRRAYAQDIQRRYDGWFAPLAGGVVGFGTDPVISAGSLVAPALYSAGLGVKMSRSALATSMTKRGALIGAGLQAPIEPFIHSWKEDIGVDYTLSDSMFNIAASGFFSGAVDGLPYAFRAWTSLDGKDLTAKSIVKMKEDFVAKGMPETQAEDMANFIHVTSTHPNQKITYEEVIQESDEIKKQMDTPAYNDEAPALSVDDDMTTAFDMIKDDVVFKTPDGDITAGEFRQRIVDDREAFEQFIGCISGG